VLNGSLRFSYVYGLVDMTESSRTPDALSDLELLRSSGTASGADASPRGPHRSDASGAVDGEASGDPERGDRTNLGGGLVGDADLVDLVIETRAAIDVLLEMNALLYAQDHERSYHEIVGALKQRHEQATQLLLERMTTADENEM